MSTTKWSTANGQIRLGDVFSYNENMYILKITHIGMKDELIVTSNFSSSNSFSYELSIKELMRDMEDNYCKKLTKLEIALMELENNES